MGSTSSSSVATTTCAESGARWVNSLGELVGREMRSHVLVPRTGRLECREETIAVKRSMMLPRCHGMLAPPPRIVRAEQADEGCTRADEQADEGCTRASKLSRAAIAQRRWG
jgi:hypothetical protein